MMNPDLAGDLADARADMESMMSDRVRITKPAGTRGPLNQGTGKYDPPARVTVYEGKARFQIRADINSNVVEPVVAEREWSYQTSTLQIPVEVDPADATMLGNPADVRADMVAEVLEAPFDSSLAGRFFAVGASYHKSQATCRRMRVKEVTG